MKRFKSARHVQKFTSIHDAIYNLHYSPRNQLNATDHRALRQTANNMWRKITGLKSALKMRQRVSCVDPEVKVTMPAQAVRAERPSAFMRCSAPSSLQNEIFHLDQFAVDPQMHQIPAGG